MQSLNLVRGLRTRRCGTDAIEKCAKIVTEDDVRNEGVVMKLMDIAVKSSEEKVRRIRKVALKAKKEAIAVLPAGWMRAAPPAPAAATAALAAANAMTRKMESKVAALALR